VLDPARPDYGGFIIPDNLTPANQAGTLATLILAFLADGSDLTGDDELFDRTMLAAAFETRWLRPTGLADDHNNDWSSPAYTALQVDALPPAVALARRCGAGPGTRAGGGDKRAGRHASSTTSRARRRRSGDGSLAVRSDTIPC